MHEQRIFETEQFREDLLSIARAGHEEIASKLRRFVYPQLREHPHFGPHIRKLKGFTPEMWRYRIELIPVRPVGQLRGFLKGIDTTLERAAGRV